MFGTILNICIEGQLYEVPKRGATFKHAGLNKPFVVVSGGGRLITGEQNLSGSALGKKLVEALTMQEEYVSAGS